MSYAAEPYAQFVDDLLTAMTGGETRQRFVFLPEEEPFRLAAPGPVMPDTVRVFGQLDGAYHRFLPRQDWELADGSVITWRDAGGAVHPDEGTAFFVNFEVQRSADVVLPLTDRNPGSVTRLLAESFAREFAVLSRQLDAVYRAGFVETAEGRDLDELASLVGVERRRGTFAAGSAVFARSTPSPADVFIPAGARLSTAEPPLVEFETTEDRTLRRGELSAEAPIAALVPGAAGVVPANTVTVIHRPILGIESVANPQATRFGAAEESDEALRLRVRRALEGEGGATTGALLAALTSLPGLRENDVRLSEDHLAHPGVVEIQVALPDLAADERDRLAAQAVERIEETRPVGVRVQHTLPVTAPPGESVPGPGEREGEEDGEPVNMGEAGADPTRMPVEVDVRVTPAAATLSTRDRAELERLVAETADAFVDRAGIGEVLIYNRLVADLMALPGVLDVDVRISPVSPAAENRRRNVFPTDPGLRPVLERVGVEIGGQLVVLHVTATVTLQGAGLVGDPAANKAEARRQIEQLLRDNLASLGGELTPQALEALLGQPEAFTATLHYTADYAEAGVRVRKRDAALPLTGLESLWIADVNLSEGGSEGAAT
ncbi:MAG TPA: baseplate J/gp47 family protein [Thermoanaerobaculia bacterium]|nr:baseplate J/gp47 family protein [Thermoanaerobaculia bacterium]